MAPLTARQQLILHCLYSRHHDGRVRQRHLEQIVRSEEPWTVPFVVQLVGEYVMEILQSVHNDLSDLADLAAEGSARRHAYGDFLARNPDFFPLTEHRTVSYRSCYHRRRFPAFGTYPASPVLDLLRSIASEHTGRRWPRHTPPGL